MGLFIMTLVTTALYVSSILSGVQSRCLSKGKSDDFTSLEDFLRVTSSLDPKESTIEYINGSVYGKLEGADLKPLFFIEGYNINRKRPEDDNYLSLSREFLVYRDFPTREILDIFINPFTGKPNEVFPIQNDPVNGKLPKDIAVMSTLLPRDTLMYEGNYILEYQNLLDPEIYPKFSAGKFYNTVELLTFFANRTEIKNTTKLSIQHINTWSRYSQFLPWLEMGQTKGSLFYATFSVKCLKGFRCIAKDLMDLIKSKFSKFFKAPWDYEEPNETSWTVFKKTIDARRKQNLSDIILPDVNMTSNVTLVPTHIDKRVLQLLSRSRYELNFNATLLPQIYGQGSVRLLMAVGRVSIVINADMNQISLEGSGVFIDLIVRQPVSKWLNPLTNKTVNVPELKIKEPWNLTQGFSYSTILPEIDTTGLTVVSERHEDDQNNDWHVSIAHLIFPNNQMSEVNPHIYGTYHHYSSWFPWMEMAGKEGTLITKAIFSTS